MAAEAIAVLPIGKCSAFRRWKSCTESRLPEDSELVDEGTSREAIGECASSLSRKPGFCSEIRIGSCARSWSDCSWGR
jgi:hypothetical protein